MSLALLQEPDDIYKTQAPVNYVTTLTSVYIYIYIYNKYIYIYNWVKAHQNLFSKNKGERRFKFHWGE